MWGGEVADLADLADGSCPIPSATRTRASDPVQLQAGGSSLNLSGCQICKCKVQARPQFQLRQHSTERGGGEGVKREIIPITTGPAVPVE